MTKITTLVKGMAMLLFSAFALSASAQGTVQLGQSFDLSQDRYYTYTPTQNGTLSAKLNPGLFSFDGSAGSFLYKGISGVGSADSPYAGTNPVDMTCGPVVNTFYIQEVSWVVNGGTQYYFYYNGDLEDITLSFEEGEGEVETSNVIEDGVPFSAMNKVMQYTPSKDGLLTITADTYYQFNWVGPSGAGLLFSNAAHTNKVLLSCADTEATPTVMTCPVKANQTYYLYNFDVDCQFTFTWSEMPVPALATVEPGPGALDAEGDYGNGVLLSFFPLDCTFSSASITYTTASGEQTIVLNQGSSGREGEEYSKTPDGLWKFQAVTMAYAGYTNTNNYDGVRNWAPSVKGTPITLTINGANFEGVAVTENNTGYSTGITIDNGTVSITWSKPEVDMALTSQIWPEILYDFNLSTTENIAVIEFNQDLSSAPNQQPSASMVFGRQTYGAGSSGDNPDPGMDLPCTVEGNTLKIDFGGIDFGALYNTQTAKNYTAMTVFVGNIFGADGQKFIQDNPGLSHQIDFVHQANPDITYMTANPSIAYVDDVMNPAIYIYWNESLSALSESAITAQLQPAGADAAFIVDATITTWYPDMLEGETVDSDNALMIPVGQYLEEYGSGQYSVSIGSVVMDNNGNVNNAYTGSVQVTTVPVLTTTQVTYAYDDENTITLHWGDLEVSVYNPYDTDILIVANAVNEEDQTMDEYHLSVGNGVEIEGTDIVIDLSDLGLTEDATYTLSIAPFYFYIGDEEHGNNEVLETFVYMPSEEPEPEPEPETPTIGGATVATIHDDMESVTGLTVTWGEYAIALNEDNNNGISVTSSMTGVPEIADIVVENNALVITFTEPIIEELDLTVTVPQGYVFVGEEGAVNEAQTLIVKTTGVALVGIDSELGRVYNLHGVKMNVKKASELPAGLYIIDGKKVIMR